MTDLRQRGGEVVAVFVHQVVGAAPKLFAQLLHDFIDVLLREVRGAQHDGLPVWRVQKDGRVASAPCTCQLQRDSLELEGLSQFGGVAGVDLKDATEGVGVTPVCKLCRDDRAEVKPTSGGDRNHGDASD